MAGCELCGCPGAGQCLVCGIPLDARIFDSSNILPAPQNGQELLLARYQLHPMHCGVLHYFAQFTDRYAQDPVQVSTPGYEWQIRCDTQVLDPYLTFTHIINPWGLWGFRVDLRLPEGCTLEFTIRNVGAAPEDQLQLVGGRIGGRHWYDTRFGGAPGQL
jgi:hypothetical protein